MIYYRQLGSGLPSPSNGFCDGIFPVVSFSDFEYAGLYEQLICSRIPQFQGLCWFLIRLFRMCNKVTEMSCLRNRADP